MITTNTGVENPLVEFYASESSKKLNWAAKAKRMPFEAHTLKPTLENSFWVLTIGKGYSKPSHRHRWCTPRLKIEPSDRFIRERVSRYGESILVLGVRKDESIKRKTSIEHHEKKGLEPNLTPSASLPNSTIYTPIVDWTTNDIWQYLLQVENPWGDDNQELFRLYRGATDSSECPLVVEENTTSCGKSRFGCYVCTVAQSEHSLTNTILNNERMEWLEPLLKLREELAHSSNSDRHLRMTKNGVQFHQNHVNSQINLEPTPGKYHQEYRAKLLTKLLQAQKDVRANAPQQYQNIELITLEELSLIRYIWLEEHFEGEDLLPQIYKSVLGTEYIEPYPDRLKHRPHEDIWDAIAELEDPQAQKLLGALLTIEAQHTKFLKKKIVHVDLNRYLSNNYSDKAELEQKLLELAKQIHQQINTLGNSLNQYSTQEQIDNIEQFNQVIQLLQEGKMLVEIHHLNGKVSPISVISPKAIVPGCIPGLESY